MIVNEKSRILAALFLLKTKQQIRSAMISL